MKTRLLHVRANVSELNRAIVWDETVLGFKVTGTWPPANPNYAHFDVYGGAMFSIMEDAKFPSNGRFNFSVEDVDGNELGFVRAGVCERISHFCFLTFLRTRSFKI